MEVGLCSFWRAEAACNELYEPFQDGTKWLPCCINKHEVLGMFPARCPSTGGRCLELYLFGNCFPDEEGVVVLE